MSINNLDRAKDILTSKYPVVPEKYTMYNGAYLFLAYPKGMKDKERCMNPYYLVDLKSNEVGPVSPVFDLDGFFKAVENMTDI